MKAQITKSNRLQKMKIEKGQLSDLDQLVQIYQNGKTALERKGIFQWTANYPTLAIIENDLKKGVLYMLKTEQKIIGAINLSSEQEDEYQKIDWQFDDAKVLVIHRLVVDPAFQGQGHASKLMDFAENFAEKNHYSSIRLDAYSPNKSVIEMYKKRKYFIRGDVYFPERTHSFHCMEKEIV